MAFGKWLQKDRHQAFDRLPILGLIALILFITLRLVGKFGNFHPFDGTNWINFLNITKYPPSLVFILLTMGINVLILALWEKILSGIRPGNPLLVFGSTPLFFYIIHLYIYAMVGFAFPAGAGLWVVYVFWLIGLLILYPICCWYRRYKTNKAARSVWKNI